MKNNFYRVKAYLYNNLFTYGPRDYIAKVSSERTLNISEICSEAIGRGGILTSETAMEYNINLFLKEMTRQLCASCLVYVGYFRAHVRIKGLFNSANEVFDK